MNLFFQSPIATESDYRAVEERQGMITKQTNLLEKEALGLVSEATDAGMDNEAITLHRAIKKL